MTSAAYVVLGAGPGLGLSAARRFARGGYAVTLVGQSVEQMEPLAQALRDEGFDAEADAVDLTDADDVTRLITGIGERHGRIDVLHFNPSAFRQVDALHLTTAQLFEDLAVGVAPVLPAVQAAKPFMPAGARVLVTGSQAADTPWHEAPSLGMQKAAVRNLVTSLDATLAPDGIRAVAVQVNGVLAKEGPFSPPQVAEALYAATVRPDDGWTAQVPYDG
ncbi:MAG TPA: SDR family NAD(P)-dependent oxidoreductase [Ornithinibacter sp.]|jgi:NAD(P)-dependent dehydrogenase (short-subunit alcohol dehydrogenase family)|nr:SDR family NAD(P)-dependent oxidoreductase [Ornithinibacter sp.]